MRISTTTHLPPPATTTCRLEHQTAPPSACLTGQDRRDLVGTCNLLQHGELQACSKAAPAVHVADALLDYVQDLIAATAAWTMVSPRGCPPSRALPCCRRACPEHFAVRAQLRCPDDDGPSLPNHRPPRLIPAGDSGRRGGTVQALLATCRLP